MARQIPDYQRFIAASRYARVVENENRRETWEETIERLCSWWSKQYPDIFPEKEIKEAILSMQVMPSMRSLLTAGKALDRDACAAYNCSFLPINDPKAFDEILYVLMCGTGVGFSVERQEVAKMPVIAESFHDSDTVIKVKDSRIGWASAFRQLISLLYSGSLPKWDLSALRPAGTPLKIFGGRSSGPDPLDDLFNFATKVFKKAAGRKLNSIECHDMCCKIAESVVVGGVRRSALISLSNLSDDRMRDSKIGTWWENNPERGLANNSAVYTEKPDMSAFMKEWLALYESKSGERGIFNRGGAIKKAKENGRRDVEGYDLGTNPCGEILLRPNGFCNLSEVVIRPEDTVETLKKKVRLATIIGTFQSTITNFRYLRNVWKRNAEEERLLGVSLTGIMDHPLTAKPSAELEKVLSELKQIAIDTNKEWANKLGIPVSAAITTIKPSGTVSQLVNAASGIHPRYSSHYIRTVRADKNDPLAQFMREQGVPCEDDVMKPDRTWVFSFPIASPDGAITANDVSAIDQLKIYLAYRRFWCEHNPSITVYVREHEWMEVGAWVYKNFDEVGGVSFLPYSDHTYRQAPYQPITKEKFKELADKMPKIDWANFKENISYTEGTQELSCVGGVCEI